VPTGATVQLTHFRSTPKDIIMSFFRLALRSAVTRQFTSPSLSGLYQSRLPQRAAFSAASALDNSQIETRVLDVLKSFEKVHLEKVCC
jgi:hypothetical protein